MRYTIIGQFKQDENGFKHIDIGIYGHALWDIYANQIVDEEQYEKDFLKRLATDVINNDVEKWLNKTQIGCFGGYMVEDFFNENYQYVIDHMHKTAVKCGMNDHGYDDVAYKIYTINRLDLDISYQHNYAYGNLLVSLDGYTGLAYIIVNDYIYKVNVDDPVVNSEVVGKFHVNDLV